MRKFKMSFENIGYHFHEKNARIYRRYINIYIDIYILVNYLFPIWHKHQSGGLGCSHS